MRHFRGANAKSQRTQRAMRRGMAIAADNNQAGLGDALLRANHMNNALAVIAQAEGREAEITGTALRVR